MTSKYERTCQLTAEYFSSRNTWQRGENITTREINRILEKSPYFLNGTSGASSCAMVVRHAWLALKHFEALRVARVTGGTEGDRRESDSA